MSLKTFALAVFALAAIGPASANARPGSAPTMIKTFGAWGLYSYSTDGRKHCYALSTPQEARPANVDHGNNYILVAPDPRAGSYYPQAVMGYDILGGSEITVAVDGRNFSMTSKGNSAWTKNAIDDAALVAAMKSGSSMTLSAISKRGTRTNYKYALAGITAALTAAAKCS
ncbi:invasion associated locus B family protein [Neorhizobium sp. T25_13]|uniref:invasion associated locus B family protein n=1 Tax=Neorhizobium sp. T25_13 TaxID=2093830 RepID=UPI000CF978DF|nr:invasion associated locus B family protein [Neorhizobium sp. T25_13]